MKPKHAPCSCGCGELADECMSGGPALGAFSVVAPQGSRPRRPDPRFSTGGATPSADHRQEWKP